MEECFPMLMTIYVDISLTFWLDGILSDSLVVNGRLKTGFLLGDEDLDLREYLVLYFLELFCFRFFELIR